MPWTVTLDDYRKGGGVMVADLTLTNGTETIKRSLSFTAQRDLKDQIRAVVTNLEAFDTNFAGLPAKGTSFDFSPAAPPVQTSGVYVATALSMAKSASKNYLSLFNADANLIVDVSGVKIAQEVTAAVTGLVRGYRLFKINAHSAGTLVTPDKIDSADPALSANITCRKDGLAATTVGGATHIASLNEDEASGGDETWLLPAGFGARQITLRQNQGIVIQQDSTAGVGLLSAAIYFNVR